MLRSEYQPTHRSELISAGALWAHVVAFAFLFPLAIARLPNKPSSRLSCLLLHPVQPFPHVCELRHLRLVVLLSEPPVSLMVHPLGPLRKWLHHVRAPSEPLLDGLCPAKSAGHLVLPLALVDQIVAMTAQEVAPRSVKECYPPAATRTWTDKPGPLPAEVTHEGVCPLSRATADLYAPPTGPRFAN